MPRHVAIIGYRIGVSSGALVARKSVPPNHDRKQTMRVSVTDAEIVEITFMIGFINCLNMFNNLLRVTCHGKYEPSV